MNNETNVTFESRDQYIQRTCETKDQFGLTWQDVAEACNRLFGLSYSKSWYSKHFHAGDFENNDIQDTAVKTYIENCNGNFSECDKRSECFETCREFLEEEKEKLLKDSERLAIERCKVADQKRRNKQLLDRVAREETIKEIAKEYADKMNCKKILTVYSAPDFVSSGKEGILLLSDWHYGIICDNPWNKFNPEICKERVNKLLKDVISIISKEKLERITILNLSDLIAGRIHSQIRIESRFDVITQTMDISEILAEFLNELSKFVVVNYYDCLDNHSRLEPDKKESMDLESLVRIIHWYLKRRLESTSSIRIHENEFGEDIITCNIKGHNVIGVHGDNDKPTTALDRLSRMTHRHYDMLCTAHLHHFSCDEQNQSIVVSNSSLMGVDSYAEKLRLTSDPSQTLIISTNKNVCECIYRIVLK